VAFTPSTAIPSRRTFASSSEDQNDGNPITRCRGTLGSRPIHIPCKPIRTIIGETNVDAAYAIQEEVTKRRIDEGARLV
jgi:hypothetical protein